MSAQIPGRLFAALLAAYVWAASLFSSDSLIFALTKDGGLPALICMHLLAVAALAAAFDTVVNDVLPAPYTWACGIRYRQSLWMALAVTYACLAWVSARSGESGVWLSAYYLICAGHSACVAYIDLWHEHAARMCFRRADDRAMAHRQQTGGGDAHA